MVPSPPLPHRARDTERLHPVLAVSMDALVDNDDAFCAVATAVWFFDPTTWRNTAVTVLNNKPDRLRQSGGVFRPQGALPWA